MANYKVVLEGGSPWGFRLKGGRGSGVPLVISKVNPGSKAAYANISVGDTVEEINCKPTDDLDQNDAQNLIRSADTSLELILSKSHSINGSLNNNNNSNMSVQTSSSIAGQQSVSNFAVDDDTVSVDGVTFHGFSPSNVSVTRTSTTKVTKTTRSRSPSPSRGQSSSSETLTVYPIKQTTVHYDSEPESDAAPVKFMSGVKWTPPGSKVTSSPNESFCTCNQSRHPPSLPNTNPGHVTRTNEYAQLSARPPRPRDRDPVTQSQPPGKSTRHRSSLYVRPRSRSSDASRKAASPWKPVTFQPRSKDDTAKYAFSSPPVPPPPPESDTEDIPPVIPPKPKVVKRKLYLSANQPQAPREIHLKLVAKGRERKTSRGAEMFLKRQAKLQQGLTKDSDSPEEPPSPQKPAMNNNEYPTSSPYAQSPSAYTQLPSAYHQPIHSQPGYIVDSAGESWPLPPPPVASSNYSQPPHSDANPARSQPNPAGISPQHSGNPYQPVENKIPAAWNPVSSNQPRGFKPVKLDLNPKPKPWRSFESTSQPEKPDVHEAPSVASSHQPTWQPPPVSSESNQSSRPVPNGDVHSPYHDEAQYSPYRPGDPHHDQDRYNPGYQQPRSETQPGQGPQDRLEFRPVPEGYSSSLPRSVSPTVTLLQYQREREKEHRSHADYLPPDNTLMPPSLVAKAPSTRAKQPAPIVNKSLHAGTYTSVISDPNDLPEGAVFQKQTVEGDVIHTDTYYPVKTREVTKKTVHKDAPRYEGIGPKDETGLPIGLRAHVKEENRHDWYKEMFKTIHKQDRPEDEIDQTYMDALMQEANMYEPSYSFPGAVDVKDDGDSVFEDDPPSVKIYPAAKTDQWSHDPTLDVSPPSSPRHHSPNTSAHNTVERYRQQPRSIIDYEPGKSSLAERDKSPTAQLYNPPVEPITAVQNTKRSTTLPRDFVQIRQVPAESPSNRLGPPGQGTNSSIFSTNSNSCNLSTSLVNHNTHLCREDSLPDPSLFPSRNVHDIYFQPMPDVVLNKDIKTIALTNIANEAGHFKILHNQEIKHTTSTHSLFSYIMKCRTFSIEPPSGVFRKPRLDLGGAPTPIRPIGGAQSTSASNGDEPGLPDHSIAEQVDNASEGSDVPSPQYGPRGTADGCPGGDQAGIVCRVNTNDGIMCQDCDTGETYKPRYLPRPTSLFEPYSLEREQERSSAQPNGFPGNSGVSHSLSLQPSGSDFSNDRSLVSSKRGAQSVLSDVSGDDGDNNGDQGTQQPGSLSPDQLTAEGEQKQKKSKLGAKHQKLKHIKKHRSDKHSPKDEDLEQLPYSERPNAKNFAPIGKRRAISTENLSLAVRSPAFNQESYQKYATGLKNASQKSETYEDLVRFYSEINRHLEVDDKERAETMKEKYMPKPKQLEAFYRTLQYFSELEMAAKYGESIPDNGKTDLFKWDMHSDSGIKKKEKDIFELYDFFEKIERGVIGTPTAEQRLEQIRMQTYLQKAKELEARQLRVGQLYEWYENIESRGSTTPSLATSQVASLTEFENGDAESEEGVGEYSRAYKGTEKQVHGVNLSLEELESLIPRVPMVDPPPSENLPRKHNPLGRMNFLPQSYPTKIIRAWSPVTMSFLEHKQRGDSDEGIDGSSKEAVTDDHHDVDQASSKTSNVDGQLPGRKTPPFMMTGRPSPVGRRKSFDKAVLGGFDQMEPLNKQKPPSDGKRNVAHNLCGLSFGPEDDISHRVTPPTSPRQEVVRPSSPEAGAPPKLPERSMSAGVIGIGGVIGTMYNPGLGRLQRWNRADLSQIEDEDSVLDEEVPSPAEVRSRAPPIGRLGKMQSDSSLPTVARGSGRSLANKGSRKFIQSQNELSMESNWRDFNTIPKPFKAFDKMEEPISETEQESILASLMQEQLESPVQDIGMTDRHAPRGHLTGIQQPNDTNHISCQPDAVSFNSAVEDKTTIDPCSELDHKSKIQLFEERIIEQCNSHHQPLHSKKSLRIDEQARTSKSVETAPSVHIRKSSGDQDSKTANEGHGGLIIGIFSKPQPMNEEEFQIWPPTPSPQAESTTPPGASYLTQSLPRNFNFSEGTEKHLTPTGPLNHFRNTSASVDCAGVDWSKGPTTRKPLTADKQEKVITRYAFSTDDIYEEQTPVSSRNVSPLPPSFGSSRPPSDCKRPVPTSLLSVDKQENVIKRYAFSTDEVYEEQTPVSSRNVSPLPPSLGSSGPPSDWKTTADYKKSGTAHSFHTSPTVAVPLQSSRGNTFQGTDSASTGPVFQNEDDQKPQHNSNPQTKQNASSGSNLQPDQNTSNIVGLSIDLKDLTDNSRPDSSQDTYTPSCSYTSSPTPSQDYLEDMSSDRSPHITRQHAPPSHWHEPEPEDVFFWDTYIPNKYQGETQADYDRELPNKDSTDLTPTNEWSESYSTLQALSPEPYKYEAPSKDPNRTRSHDSDFNRTSAKNVRKSTDSPKTFPTKVLAQSRSTNLPGSPAKYPRGHPRDKPYNPMAVSPRLSSFPKGDVLIPQKSSTLPQQRKSPRMKEESIRSSSRPLSSTLPRAKTKSQSQPLDSGGLSAAQRLGIKSPPPQRTPSITGSKPSRHSSGSDKIYNYRDPPPTLDKAKAEKLIEEERRRKERLQVEEQKYRRHSDFTPIKSPIITNERFRDPVISAKDDGRKQEVKACAIALYPFKAQTHKELSFTKADIIYLLRKIDKNWFEGEHHGNAGIFPSSYVEVVTSLEDAKKAQQYGPGLEGKGRAKYKFTGETPMELSFNKGEYIGLSKKVDSNWWEGYIGDRKGIFPSAYIEVLREPTGVINAPSAKSPPAASPTSYHPSSQPMVQSNSKQQYRQQTVPRGLEGRSSQRAYGSNHRDPEPYFEQPVPKPSRTLVAAQDLYVASYAYAPQNEDEIELQEGDLVNVLEKCDDGWYVGMSERTGMFGTFPGNYVYKHET